MKTQFTGMLAVAIAASMFSTAALAHDYKIGALEIDHPWVRAMPKGAKVAGGYMKIRNTGDEADRLIGGTMVRAERVEVHEMKMDNNVMRMREIEGGLEIKPGETVELKPGGFHLMFMQVTDPYTKGEIVRGTIEFANAGKIDISFTVEAIGEKAKDHGDHAGHGKTH